MAGLAQFLEEIGAGELPSAVTIPTAQDGLGPMGLLLSRVQQEIDAVNDQTRALLVDNWQQFTDQVQTGQSLLAQLEQEERQLLELEELMDGKDAILPPLLSGLKSHAELSTSHANSAAELVLYNTLLSFHQHINSLSSLTSSGALPQAVAALASLLTHQQTANPDRWIATTDAFRSLERWAVDERARLEAALITAVEGCFVVEPGKEDRQPDEPHATLRLRSSVEAAPGARALGVTELLEALEAAYKLPATDSTLTKNRTVEYHLSRVAKQLIKHFVTPFLHAAGAASTGAPPVSFGYATAPDNPSEQIALLVPEAPHQPPLATLSAFLSFVGSHSSLIPSPWAASFTKHFTPALQTLVIDSFLSPSLPDAIADLPPYLALLVAASGFEGEFLPRGGWLSFLPPPAPGAPAREEATVIKSWMARVDKHWAKRVGDAALSSVREVVQTNDWQSELVETEVVEVISAPPPPPPAPKEPTPPPPAPPTIVPPPPQAHSSSPVTKTRNFPPAGVASPTLAPSLAAPAPRPGKLGTRIGSPATTIPIKPKAASAGTAIPIKPKSVSVPIPVRVRTNASSPSQSHFPRESVAKVAENGLVAAGIAKAIEHARAASPSPPQQFVSEFPSATAPAQQAPVIVAPTPVVAGPTARRVSVTSPPPPSSSPGVSRSPSIGKKRRGSIVSHAPVTHVEPSAEEPEWNLALSPVIDPVAELGWGSGPGFFDMLNNNPVSLEPVLEQEPVAEELVAAGASSPAVQETRAPDAADLSGAADEDGWELGGEDEAEGAEFGDELATSELMLPPAVVSAVGTPSETAFDPAPPQSEFAVSHEFEPFSESLRDNDAVHEATPVGQEGVPTPTDRAVADEAPVDGDELVSPISPPSITGFVPDIHIDSAAAAVAGAAAAVGAGTIGAVSHLFGASSEHEGEADLENGDGDGDGWGIEGEEQLEDDEPSWRYEPPPPLAPTPEPPAQEDEEEEASGWQYEPPKALEPEPAAEVEHDEESGWGYEPSPGDELDPEAGHEVDEESWGYDDRAETTEEKAEVQEATESVPVLPAADESPLEHGQDSSDYTVLEEDVAAREHTYEPRDEDEYDPEAGVPVEEGEDEDPWALEESGQIDDAAVAEPAEEVMPPPVSPQVKRTISSVETAELQPAYKPFSVEPVEDVTEAEGSPDTLAETPAEPGAEAEHAPAPAVEAADEQLPLPAVADDAVPVQHVEEPLVVEAEAEVEPTGWGLPHSDAVAERDLLSAHDYLPRLDAATPLESHTPEEFIVPGDGLAAVPTMLVPELFEVEPKRQAYEDYGAEPAGEDEGEDGWDLEGGEEGEDEGEVEQVGEPAAEPFGEPDVEEAAGAVEHEEVAYEPTSTFEVVVDSTPARLSEEPEAAVEAERALDSVPLAIEEADQVDLVKEARKHSPPPIDTTPPMVTISIQPPSPASTTATDVPPEFQPELAPTPEAAEDDLAWDEEEEARLIREVEEAERELAEAQAEAQAKAEQRAERRASVLPSLGAEEAGEGMEEEEDEWDAEEEARLQREVEEAEKALEEAEEAATAYMERSGAPGTPAPERTGYQYRAASPAQDDLEDLVARVSHLENPESERDLAPDVEAAEHVPALEDAPVEAELHHPEPAVEIAVEPAEAEAELTDGELAAAAPTEAEVESAEPSEDEGEHAWDLDEESAPVEPEVTAVPMYGLPVEVEEKAVIPQAQSEGISAPVPEAEVAPFAETRDRSGSLDSAGGDAWDLEDHHDHASLEHTAHEVPTFPVAESKEAESTRAPDSGPADYDEPADQQPEADDGWGLQAEEHDHAHEPAVYDFVNEVDFPAVRTERELSSDEPVELTPVVDKLPASVDSQASAEPDLEAPAADDGWGIEPDHQSEEEEPEPAGPLANGHSDVLVEHHHQLASTNTTVHEPLVTTTYEPPAQFEAEPEHESDQDGWDLEQDDAEPEEAEEATLDQVAVAHLEREAEPQSTAVDEIVAADSTPVHNYEPEAAATLVPDSDAEVPEDDGWGIEAEEAEPIQPENNFLASHELDAARHAEPEHAAPAASEPEAGAHAPEDEGWGLGEEEAKEGHAEEEQMSSPEVIHRPDSFSPPPAQPAGALKPQWTAAAADSPAVHPPTPRETPQPESAPAQQPVPSYAAAASAEADYTHPVTIHQQPALSVQPDADLLGTSNGTEDGDGWGFSPGTSPAEYEEYVPPTPVAHSAPVAVAVPTRAPAPPPPAPAPFKTARPAASAPQAPAQGDDGWGFEDGLELDLDLGEPQEDVYEDMDAPSTPQVFAPAQREKSTTHPRAPPSLTSSVSNQSYASSASHAGGYGFTQEHARTATPLSRAPVLSPSYSHRSYGSSASASYAFSPPSSSRALSPPPPESEEEAEEAEDAWGFDDDSLEMGEDEAEALRLRGGAYSGEGEGEQQEGGGGGGWELKRNSLPLKEGQKLRRRKEEMAISSSSKQLLTVAEGVLVQALAVGEAGFPYPAFAPASTPLFQTFISLFALYRATAPVLHAQLLSSVPALGMQFANDALWIGDELDRVWDRLGGQYRPDLQRQTEAVNDTVRKMKRMGKDLRAGQVDLQRRALMELLDEAGGFRHTADEARFAGCERALQQVVHSLTRLAGVWKGFLNPAVLWSVLGGLINDVLVRVLDEIEGQADISEEESGRLNKLCKRLHDLDQLFEGTTTSIGREVRTYFKFVFLSELLEASMADVLFLFDNGHLVDFAPAEIARLVRALFADSPLRARNLEHILRGHPEGLGAIGEEEEEDGWGV